MIEVIGLSKAYRRIPAVNDLSFSVRPGQILGLVGPNGAGKTTTLQALAGVIHADRGTVSLATKDQPRGPLAYVPDEPHFFDTLTAWEHATQVIARHRLSHGEESAENLFKRFGLWEQRNAFPDTLSRGLRQRLALVCAFLPSPSVLLLDEPTTGLDEVGKELLRDQIAEAAEKGTSVILASPTLEEVDEICTHLLLLDGGKKILEGEAEQITNKIKGLPRRKKPAA